MQVYSAAVLSAWTFTGNVGDLTGQQLASGDIHGDGYDDIVVGSQYGDAAGNMHVNIYIYIYIYIC
jgi:hypothetical protein